MKKSNEDKSEYQTLTIKVGQYKHCLWVSASSNFIGEQPNRFQLLEGVETLTGTLYFCNTYLEACCVRAIYDGTAIYDDEASDDLGSYVVASLKPFDVYNP